MKNKLTTYILSAICLVALLNTSCSKSSTGPVQDFSSGTSVAVVPNVTKMDGYVVKSGSVTINYRDSSITFSAPTDSITYTYGPIGNYYSQIYAINAKKNCSVSLKMSAKPFAGLANSPFKDLQLNTNIGKSNAHNYTPTSDITQYGTFSIDIFGSDAILLSGSFSVPLIRTFPVCLGCVQPSVTASGSVNLSY